MRIWDLPPSILCKDHLLGEHRELHAIWNVITKKKKGYSKHPETLRWFGKLKALYLKHEEIVGEMRRRGYKHQSSLDLKLAKGLSTQTAYVDPPAQQKIILSNKKCACSVSKV